MHARSKRSRIFKFVALELVFFTFECQCLEQCELHWVPGKAVLSGLECGGVNHAGAAVCFIRTCVPEMTSDLIKCLSSSHPLHTWNKPKEILLWCWTGAKIRLTEPPLIYSIVVVCFREVLLWELDPSFGTPLIWGRGRRGSGFGWALSVLPAVGGEKCMCSRPNTEQRCDSLLASGTSWANNSFVDFSGNPVLLPKPVKKEETQEWEIQV